MRCQLGVRKGLLCLEKIWGCISQRLHQQTPALENKEAEGPHRARHQSFFRLPGKGQKWVDQMTLPKYRKGWSGHGEIQVLRSQQLAKESGLYAKDMQVLFVLLDKHYIKLTIGTTLACVWEGLTVEGPPLVIYFCLPGTRPKGSSLGNKHLGQSDLN